MSPTTYSGPGLRARANPICSGEKSIPVTRKAALVERPGEAAEAARHVEHVRARRDVEQPDQRVDLGRGLGVAAQHLGEVREIGAETLARIERAWSASSLMMPYP